MYTYLQNQYGMDTYISKHKHKRLTFSALP